MICAWIETSSAETGSSQTTSSGRSASARAMPMRWRWPPENSDGKAVVVLGVEADELHQLLHLRACRSSPSATPWIANGSPMIEPTRRRGLSEPYGSWKIICMRRR